MATQSTTLFSLTKVKDYLGVNNDDARLETIADAVSVAIERMTARSFVTRTKVKTFDAKGSGKVYLPDVGVASITTIRTRTGFDVAWSTVLSTAYELDPDTGIVHVFNDTVPVGPRTIEVTYVVGDDVQDGTGIPFDLYQAGLDYVKFIYHRMKSDTVLMTSVSLGGFSATSLPKIPADIEGVILGYRRIRTLCL